MKKRLGYIPETISENRILGTKWENEGNERNEREMGLTVSTVILIVTVRHSLKLPCQMI